jgi:hypothetical protein
MYHEMRVGAPTIGSQNDRTPHEKQVNYLIQHIFVYVIGHTMARRFEDFPHQRHGAATRDEQQAHHAVGIPQR